MILLVALKKFSMYGVISLLSKSRLERRDVEVYIRRQQPLCIRKSDDGSRSILSSRDLAQVSMENEVKSFALLSVSCEHRVEFFC